MPLFGPPNISMLKVRRDVGGLLKALDYKDSKIRADAAQALGDLKDRRAIQRLSVRAFTDEPAVREAAARALLQIDANWRESESGRVGLREVGVPHVKVLRQLRWTSGASWVAGWSKAAAALGEIADERAVEALVDAATVDTVKLEGFYVHVDDFAKTREAIVEVLRKIGGERAINLLAAKLKADARCAAAQVLGEMRDARAVPALVAVLPRAFEAKRNVIEALGKIGDPRAAEALLDALGQYSEEADKVAAIKALGLIGDRRAVDTLSKMVRGPYGAAAMNALRQIGELGDVEPMITVLRAAGSAQEYERLAAIDTLRESHDPRAVEAMVDVAINDYIFANVREAAEKAVINAADPHAVAPVIAALGQEEMLQETLEAGKRMLGQLVNLLADRLSPEDLRALADLKDGTRVVKNWGERWDSYNERREWVPGTVTVEFATVREHARRELTRRGLKA
jgi:HEAT repeat protein